MPNEQDENKVLMFRQYDAKKNEWGASYAELDPEHIKQYEAHISEYLGPIQSVFSESVPERFRLDVCYIAPSEARPCHILITEGMSALPMNVPEGLEHLKYAELMFVLPAEWPVSMEAFADFSNYWPVYYLKDLARFPFEHNTWLGFGHTVPVEEYPNPVPGTGFNALFLIPPVSFGQEMMRLQIEGGRAVNFYAIVPIFPEEYEFKQAFGLQTFLGMLDQNQVFEKLDVKRKNMAAEG